MIVKHLKVCIGMIKKTHLLMVRMHASLLFILSFLESALHNVSLMISDSAVETGSISRCRNAHVRKFLKSSLEVEKELPLDSGFPFCKGANGVHTKSNFLLWIRSWAAQHGVTKNAVLEVLVELNNFSNGSLKLGLRRNDNDDMVLDMDRYLPTDRRDYAVHICPQECCSFFDDTIQCSTCCSWRFTKCKRQGCLLGEQCNPFDQSRPGYHGLSQRTPQRCYFYRSLITLIRELLQWALVSETDLFQRSTIRSTNTVDYAISDVLHGSQAKDYLKKMHERYQVVTENNRNVEEVSLLLSDFYDGGSLFKRDTLSIWPLIVEFLNCLPTDRCKSGIGQHLIALHDMKLGSIAEHQLFSELYIQELYELENGIEVSLTHNGVRFNYFVQARVIVHRLDTRALEKVAKIQTAGSKAGCSLCNTLTGVSRMVNHHPFKRVIYYGYRCLLPRNHWLRYCGMSKKCCPEGYYQGNNYDYNALKANPFDSTIEHEYNELNRSLKQSCDKSFAPPKDKCLRTDKCLITCNKDSMFNGRFKRDDFMKHCEPAHCDLRCVQFFRRPKEYYESPNTCGVTGSSVYSGLEASNNANAMCYDPFHAIKNFSTDIIKLLIGEEGCEKTHIEAMQYEGRFLRIKLSDKSKYLWEIPWLLSTEDCVKADAALNCILIPVGLKTKFNAKNALKTPGVLKGDELIQYLCVYMTFSLQFTGLNVSFKNLFALCGMVCSNILCPYFKNDEAIDDLFNKTVEMLCLFECMLPDTAQKFTHHELLDIVDSIKKFGPIRCWWTLSGERLMKKLKDCVPLGGVNPLKTMYDAFVWKEKSYLSSYECDKSQWNNADIFCDNAIKLEGSSELLKLSKCDANFIMYAVYHCMQISELDHNLENLKRRSPFFLAYCSYRESQHKSSMTFLQWLRFIADTEGEMGVFANYGVAIYNSVSALIHELIHWRQVEIYTRALVRGRHHRARGSKFADHEAIAYKTKEKFTDSLASQWWVKEHYSSWCKFTSWNFNSTPMGRSTQYGQLNYFFRINWEHDDVVKHLSFASISSRVVREDTHGLHYLSIAENTRSKCFFIPLYVIESTNVAVCGTSGPKTNPKPILVGSTKDTDKLRESSYERDTSKIARLHFIDMDPERRGVDSSFDDSRLPERKS